MGTRSLPRFPWVLTTTSIKHTVTLIADFEAPLVDIQITFERDFHCGSINFQANFARTLRPTNDNLFRGITALLHFDFYEVKFLTSLRILKLCKKKANKYTFRDACIIIIFRQQGRVQLGLLITGTETFFNVFTHLEVLNG